MASPRRSLKMNGRAGRDKNFFQMSASRLQSKERPMSRPERQRAPRNRPVVLAGLDATAPSSALQSHGGHPAQLRNQGGGVPEGRP